MYRGDARGRMEDPRRTKREKGRKSEKRIVVIVKAISTRLKEMGFIVIVFCYNRSLIVHHASNHVSVVCLL
jgi:hypothetical protein